MSAPSETPEEHPAGAPLSSKDVEETKADVQTGGVVGGWDDVDPERPYFAPNLKHRGVRGGVRV